MTKRARMAAAAVAVALVAGTVTVGLSGGAVPFTPVVDDLRADPIRAFRIADPAVTRFGALTFKGGLVLLSAHPAVGGLSGLVVPDGGDRLLAISDDGLAFAAAIRRDAAGRPAGLADGRAARLVGPTGRPFTGKLDGDTEALDVLGDRVIVGVEGRPRILQGRLEPSGFPGRLAEVRLPRGMETLRRNGGLEAVAIGRPGTVFEGAVVAVAEEPPRGMGGEERPGWIVGGATPGRFTVTGGDGYSVTDAKVGPDGALYLLERSFGLRSGLRCRIRRFPAGTVRPDARVGGEVLLTADLADQIDNMEGLAVWTAADGGLRLSLVSDDNRSFLQRTVYLEFALPEGAASAGAAAADGPPVPAARPAKAQRAGVGAAP